MTDPIEIISVADAVALALAVPDVVQADAGVATYRRAEAVEIGRTGNWRHPVTGGGSWRATFPRIEQNVLPHPNHPDGKVVPGDGLAPLRVDLANIATRTIDIPHPDGRVFRLPIVLAHAIVASLYVALETGVLPTPTHEPEAP